MTLFPQLEDRLLQRRGELRQRANERGHEIREDIDHFRQCIDHNLEQKVPLSLSFLHKPLRASKELEKATTRHNSLTNRYIGDPGSGDQLIQHSPPTKPASPSPEPASTESSIVSSPEPTYASSPPTSPLNDSPERPDPPPLVRKKLGEVVRLNLASPNHRRVRLMPLTPTYKLVHFGQGPDVKYFKRKDKPLAISNPNSPEPGLLESDLDWLDIGWLDLDAPARHPKAAGNTNYPVRALWMLKLHNFPPLSYIKRIEDKCPVFLERIFLLEDKLLLIGHVAVGNLAFEKNVTVRYSLDNWLTINEIPTKYNEDAPDILKRHNYDRFVFDIPLEQLFNSFYLELSILFPPNERTYEFCLKYGAKGKEFWDNNRSKNYLVTLSRVREKKKEPNGTKKPPSQQTATISPHMTRPKYSLSYLKRRTLDSLVPVTKKQQEANGTSLKTQSAKETTTKPPSEVAPKTNDTLAAVATKRDVKDASVKTGSTVVEPKQPLPQRPAVIQNPPSLAPTALDLNQLYLSLPLLRVYNNDVVAPRTDTASPLLDIDPNKELTVNHTMDSPIARPPLELSRPPHQFLDSKSYSELLENYCFFQPEKETANCGDKPLSPEKAPFSIHSFLHS